MKKLMILVAMVTILFTSCNFIEDLLGIKDDDKDKTEVTDTTVEKTEDPTEKTPPDPFPGMTRHDLDSAGGTIVDDSGYTITIPEAAVPTNTALYLKTLSAAETPAAEASRVLFALHGEVVTGTETFTGFAAPLMLSIPAPTLEPGDFVMIREFDPVRKVYLPSTHSYTIDRVGKTINLEVSHFSAITAEVIEELKRAENECKDPATSCRCGKVQVESDNDDYSCTKDGVMCFVLRDFVEVQFLDCPGTPVESASLAQISPNCQASMTLTASELMIEPNDTVDLEALFQLGCAPFKGKNVIFTVSGPGTLQKTTEVTDTKGKAQNQVTATGTGTIEVSITGTADYWEQEEIINGEVQVQEGYHDVNETAAVTIQVIEKPVMTLTASPSSIESGGSSTITARITQQEQGVEGAVVNFVLSGPGSLSAASAVTNATGNASVSLSSSGGDEGTATITADSNVEIVVGSESIFVPLMKQTEVVIENLTTGGISLKSNRILTSESTTVSVKVLHDNTPVPDVYVSLRAFTVGGDDITYYDIHFDDITSDITNEQGIVQKIIRPDYYNDELGPGERTTVIIKASGYYFDSEYHEYEFAYEKELTVVDDRWEGIAQVHVTKNYEDDDCRLVNKFKEVETEVTVNFFFSLRGVSTIIHKEAFVSTDTLTCTPQASQTCEVNSDEDSHVQYSQYATFIPPGSVSMQPILFGGVGHFTDIRFGVIKGDNTLDPYAIELHEGEERYVTNSIWVQSVYTHEDYTGTGYESCELQGITVLDGDENNAVIPIEEGIYTGEFDMEQNRMTETINYTLTLSRVEAAAD